MDKSSDSSSDSDSSSSTSWVFIEDTSPTSSKVANTFHLDCSREPIQELTEQDLLSAGSDFESDTDGISVISESEVPTDDPFLNIQTIVFPNNPVTIEEKIEHNDPDMNVACNDIDEPSGNDLLLVTEQHDKLSKMKPLHMLGIGVLLTAVLLGCYSRITTRMSKDNANFNVDNVPLYEEVDDVSAYKKVDLTSGNDASIKNYGTKTDLNKDLEEIIDITMTCAFHHVPNFDVMDKRIKKCAKMRYNTKKTAESFDDYKKKEIKLKKLNNNYQAPQKIDDDFERHLKHEVNVAIKCHKKDDKADKICRKAKQDYRIYKTMSEDKNKKHENKEGDRKVIKLKLPKNKIVEGEIKKDYKASENYEHPKKYQMPTYNKYQKDKIHNYRNKKEINKNTQHKYLKDFNIGLKNKDKESTLKRVHNGHAEIKDDYEFKNGWKSRNLTAEWHSKLHKARSELRKQEHVSDWIFDRAYLRNKKRNKAQWYFKWMNIREQLRYKQSYKPYSS